MNGDMGGGFAIVALIIYFIVLGVPLMQIIHKAGYSRAWVLILLIPIVNVIMLWVFAFSRWPVLARQGLAAALDSAAILVAASGVSALSGSGLWMTMAAAGLSYYAASTIVLGRSAGSWCLLPTGSFARMFRSSSIQVAELEGGWLAAVKIAPLQARAQDSTPSR